MRMFGALQWICSQTVGRHYSHVLLIPLSFLLFVTCGNAEITSLTLESHEISEDVHNDVDLFNVSANVPNSKYVITGSSIQGKDLFYMASGNLRLKTGLNTTMRKLFDYETFHHVSVFINATSISDPSSVTMLTVVLRLTDVNDEPPVFTNEPTLFLAVMNTSADAGAAVFVLTASDPDSNPNLRMIIESVTPQKTTRRFKLETIHTTNGAKQVACRLVTLGNDDFPGGTEYEVKISVIDDDAVGRSPQITTKTVFVKVGTRPPQFYSATGYKGCIYETNGINTVQVCDGDSMQGPLEIRVKQFQAGRLQYELLNNGVQSSTYQLQQNGHVGLHVVNKQDLDYENLSDRSAQLTVRVTQNSLTSTTSLELTVLDENDQTPTFTALQFQVTIKENTKIGISILQVEASDADSGPRGDIKFSIDNDHFDIMTIKSLNDRNTFFGNIKVKRDLDYDRLGGNTYNFQVTAQDNGVVPKSSTALVRVTTTNVNDNPPDIAKITEPVKLLETATANSMVFVVAASDIDGDRSLTYAITGITSSPGNEKNIFTIDNQGIVRLNNSVPNNVDSYGLTVTVTDDGSCCGEPFIVLSSNETFVVSIEDVNENRPDFTNCASYDNTAVREESEKGTKVLQVHAEDDDRGQNGHVLYYLQLDSTDHLEFKINKSTGLITVEKVFTIEDIGRGYIQLTVVGKNPPSPGRTVMEGFCAFRVTIEDINNHAPEFVSGKMNVSLPANTNPYEELYRVQASDEDIGMNGNITFTLEADTQNMFAINPITGIIRLEKPLLPGVKSYSVVIVASDNGGYPRPLTSNMTLIFILQAENIIVPIWYDAKSEYKVNEVSPRGTVIATLYCGSNKTDDPNVEFFVYEKIISESSSLFGMKDNFAPGGHRKKMELVTERTEYAVKDYRVTITCMNIGLHGGQADISPTIKIIDVNNKDPKFQGLDGCCYRGHILENSLNGTNIVNVSATDDDVTPPNNVVTFSLHNEDKRLFGIKNLGDNRASVYAKVSLDRENVSRYVIKIIATDGAPAFSPLNPDNNTLPNSVERTLIVNVDDVNDNYPYFEQPLYTCIAAETLLPGHEVCQVKAKDLDTVDGQGLNYYFESGNINSVFSIQRLTGMIRVSRKLDYEDPKQPKVFNLSLKATDLGGKSNTTTVVIRVVDENDNKPEFTQKEYVVKDVTEEDTSVTQSNPLFLVKVHATDRDINRSETHIQYSLLGSYTEVAFDQKFTIDKNTGRVFLVGVLDREATSNPSFSFNVVAEDEGIHPLKGYATVKVTPMDINDNKPVFMTDSLRGYVDEDSQPDTSVCTVLARDQDAGLNGTVNFRIVPLQQVDKKAAYFNVTHGGEIHTNTLSSNLDRETTEFILLVIEAYDLAIDSMSSSATVTIYLRDINDQSPVFDRKEYIIKMCEDEPKSTVIRTLSATDDDINPVNKELLYHIQPRDHFDVDSFENKARIIVIKEVDYEAGVQEFNLILTVTDGVPGHNASARVKIFVEDYNDNRPQFLQELITRTMPEELEPGTFVATFSATDNDGTSPNNLFKFSVDPASDPLFEFFIHPVSGNVTTRKRLDREKGATREILILAIDQGEDPLSSTATLSVILTDINDNAPRFREHYLPRVEENKQYSNFLVAEVMAIDPDAVPYGAPFGFKLPDNCNVLACKRFSLEFNPGGDHGRGSALIRTSSMFDREDRKQYYLPIVMSDMYGSTSTESRTATGTLTIVVEDKNDNRHGPGHQDIFVYILGDQTNEVMDIGQVYTDDPDDWDLPNKTFTDLQPEIMRNFFMLDKDTGMIRVKANVPPMKEGRDPYNLQVKVTDKKWGNTETCTVAVTLRQLSDQAARVAGTMKLAGITGEEFIVKSKEQPRTSKFNQFQELVRSLVGYQTGGSVEVVSLRQVGEDLEVRFSAHASPYLKPAQLESAVLLNKQQLEQALNVKIRQVPVNLCLEEMYTDGCYTYVNVTGRSSLTNANGTSFVGPEIFLSAQSGCADRMFPESDQCTGDYCFNGGTCLKDDWAKLSCECTKGFTGPRCQQRDHSFDGTSIAFYHGLEACANGRTSIEFITDQDDGVIMYSGPTGNGQLGQEVQDYLILELRGGYPRLRFNLGIGEAVLELTGLDQSGSIRMEKLSDGRWHHIDIDHNHQLVTLMVDYCSSAQVDTNGFVSDWSPCRTSSSVPGGDILLNTQNFLQLGGRYPFTDSASYPADVGTQGFVGCLRNLIHNTKMYDLSFRVMPALKSGLNGCPREESICGDVSGSNPVCGVHAFCESQWQPKAEVTKCTCHPGWYGQTCQLNTPVRDLKTRSYFKWKLSQMVIGSTMRDCNIDVTFRTRQTNGNLFTITNAAQQTILLELLNGHLSVNYNLGKGSQTLTLVNTKADTGQWHTAHLARYGNELILTMDGGEGRFCSYHPMRENMKVEFQSQMYISSGAHLPAISSPVTQIDVSEDLVDTCVQDIRFVKWLPLTISDNASPVAGAELVASNNTVEGCTRPDCQPNPCKKGTCFPLWEEHQCRCPGDLIETSAGVCPSPCLPNPCFNAVSCTVVNIDVHCTCPARWEGSLCNSLAIVVSDEVLSAGAITGIVISILVLLALVAVLVLFLVCKREDDEKKIIDDDPDYDVIRENVIFYDEEGAGEEDNEGYDITLLALPIDRETSQLPWTGRPVTDQMPVRKSAPQINDNSNRPDIRGFIDKNIEAAEDPNADPFNDSLHQYDYEGGNSEAGSLSSLNTHSSDASQDYDFLNEWSDKFARLADMYGAGKDDDDD